MIESDDASDTRTEPPWLDLDDGIRETVRALWLAGFEPTDSGDGRKRDMDCSLDVPAVFMRVDASRLISEAERLNALVTSWGVPAETDAHGATVQASYAPAEGIGVLMLFGVLDAVPLDMLRAGRGDP